MFAKHSLQSRARERGRASRIKSRRNERKFDSNPRTLIPRTILCLAEGETSLPRRSEIHRSRFPAHSRSTQQSGSSSISSQFGIFNDTPLNIRTILVARSYFRFLRVASGSERRGVSRVR